MTTAIEPVPVSPKVPASTDSNPPSRRKDGFDFLMQILSGQSRIAELSGEAAAQEVAHANVLAQSNQRITDDDFRRAGEQTQKRGASPDIHHPLRYGAVEVERAELGFGQLAGLFKKTPSSGTMSLAQDGGQSRARPGPEPTSPMPAFDPETRPSKPTTFLQTPSDAEPTDRIKTLVQPLTVVRSDSATDAPVATGTKTTLERGAVTSVLTPAPVIAKSPTQTISQTTSTDLRGLQTPRAIQTQNQMQHDSGTQSADLRQHADVKKTTPGKIESSPMLKTTSGKTISDVLHVIRSNLDARESVIKMQLSPPELGRLRIDLRVIDDEMHIRIAAEKNEVRDWLQSGASTLSEALKEQGLQLKHYEVIWDQEQNEAFKSDPQSTQDEAAQQPFSDVGDPSSSLQQRQEELETENSGGMESNATDSRPASQQHVDIRA